MGVRHLLQFDCPVNRTAVSVVALTWLTSVGMALAVGFAEPGGMVPG